MTTGDRPDLLARSVVVLETLAGMELPVPLPLLSERLGSPVSQTYRVLRALQEQGFVDHVGRRGYRLGSRALGLGVLLGPRPELRALAHPVLARLAASTSIMARLHVRSGPDRILLLAALPPPERTVPPSVRVGERAPLTRGCSGLAILAHLEPDELDAVLRCRPPDDEAALRRDVRRIRRDGYATSLAANHAGRRGVAAPVVLERDSGPFGAVSLSAHAATCDEALLDTLTPRLVRAAADLGARFARHVGPQATDPSSALDLRPPPAE